MTIKFGSDHFEVDGHGLPNREKLLEHYLPRWNITAEEYDLRVKEKIEREKNVPVQGGLCHDFELEFLAVNGERTGKMFKLSENFDKPLALVFGSYT